MRCVKCVNQMVKSTYSDQTAPGWDQPFSFLWLRYLFFREITLFDLAVPDSYCSPDPNVGYQCPKGMKCMELDIAINKRGFNGFDELREYYN